MPDQSSPQTDTVELWRNIAGGVAFEVSNALATIEGYAELSQEALDPVHPVAAHIAQIKQAAQRATQALNPLKEQLRAKNTKPSEQ